MNSPDWLRRLPSVNEILDKAPMRAVVQRWNRTAVAARVRSFLEEIRDEVQARTGEISLAELAERAARYVVGPAPRGMNAVINATGQLWGEPLLEQPLAESALERALLTARDYQGDFQSANEIVASSDAERLACQLSGAEAAAYWHSRPGALELVLWAVARGGSVVIGRGEVGRLTTECRLTDVAIAVGSHLVEVGAIDATTVDDFAACCKSAAAIMRIELEDYVILGQAVRPGITELAQLAREAKIPLIVDVGRNPLIEGLPTDGRDTVIARRALSAGANLVLVRTDGFLGGPPGALLLGDMELIERVRRLPLAAAHRPLAMSTAALAATLELCRDTDQARFAVPLLSLLDTPLENLQTRAERLAPQMDAVEGVAAETLFLPESSHNLPRACRLPSWGIALAPRAMDRPQMAETLAQAVFPVVGREVEGRLVLDLRTVFPRQDLDLLSAVTTV